MLQKLTKGKLKYFLIIGILFVVYMAFIDENNWIKQGKDRKKLNETSQSIEYLNRQSDKLEKELSGLQNNPEVIEKYAREKYFHKADNEDVYLVIDSLLEQKNKN